MPARLDSTAYTEVPWRIHQIADDFRLEDVWAVRTPGAGPHDFHTVLEAIERWEASQSEPALLRLLLAVRWKLGALFGWDEGKAGLGARVEALHERLPEDMAKAAPGSDLGLAPFVPVYRLGDECVLELANKTVHTAMHLGWARGADGDHELRMAVLVKPNGLPGRMYMAAIAPFRHTMVLPIFLRRWETAWRQASSVDAGPGSVHAAVGIAAVPESSLALASLPVIDYADEFTLSTNVQASPEHWARAMFGDVPNRAERLIWHSLLGLRLLPGPSRSTVAGWRIADGGADWIRLEASGPIVGNLVVRTASGQVSLTTLIHYARGRGRAVWTPSSALHRRLAPGLLRDAAAVVSPEFEGVKQ